MWYHVHLVDGLRHDYGKWWLLQATKQKLVISKIAIPLQPSLCVCVFVCVCVCMCMCVCVCVYLMGIILCREDRGDCTLSFLLWICLCYTTLTQVFCMFLQQ